MSKRLPYFQFEPAQYLSGDIQLCSYAAQGVFINVMAIYWQRDCNLTLDQAKRRLKSDSFEELIDENIIKVEDGRIIIAFLDEQYELISKRKKLLSDAGRKGAQIKKDKATLKPPLNNAKATLKQPDKIKEDKKKGNKIIEDDINKGTKKFVQPSIDDLKDFFIEKGLTEGAAKNKAEAFLNHYKSNGWKVGKNPMKDWKAAASGTWMKDDSKKNETGRRITEPIKDFKYE